MISTRELTFREFNETKAKPAVEITDQALIDYGHFEYAGKVFRDYWPNANSGTVRWIYRMGNTAIYHMILQFIKGNDFLVVVIDSREAKIIGHFRMNETTVKVG